MELSYEAFLHMAKDPFETPQEQETCPVAKTLNVIQGKWKAHILFFLCKRGKSRFGEIHKGNPQVSKTMFSTMLKQLEADGIVIRQQHNEMPPRTEYSLTESGQQFMPIFYEMYKWGAKYL